MIRFTVHIRGGTEFFTSVDRNKLNVHVRHIQTLDLKTNPFFIREELLQALGYLPDRLPQRLVVERIEIKEGFSLRLGYHEHHTRLNRVNIEESKRAFILIYLVGGDFSSNNLRKYTVLHIKPLYNFGTISSMPIKRLSFAFVLVSTLLTLTLGIWVLTTALSQTIGKPDQTKTLLHKSGLYQALIPSQIADAQQNNPSLAKLPLDNPDIQKVLASGLGTTQLEQQGDKAVDGIYDWLDGKSAQPSIHIAVQADQQALATAAGNYAVQYAAKLPTCAPGESSYTGFASDPLSAACIPLGITSDMVRSFTTSAVLSNPAFGASTVINQDDIKLPGNKSIVQAFGSAPKWYRWARLLPLISGAAAVLFAVLVLIMLRWIDGIRSIGRHLFSVGLTLGICAAALAWAMRKGFDYVVPSSNNANINAALSNLTNSFDDAYRNNIIHLVIPMGIAGLVLIIVAFVLKKIFRRSTKTAPGTPKTEPKLPEAESLAAAPVAASFTPSGPPELPKKAARTTTARKKAAPKKKTTAKKPAVHRKKKA